MALVKYTINATDGDTRVLLPSESDSASLSWETDSSWNGTTSTVELIGWNNSSDVNEFADTLLGYDGTTPQQVTAAGADDGGSLSSPQAAFAYEGFALSVGDATLGSITIYINV